MTGGDINPFQFFKFLWLQVIVQPKKEDPHMNLSDRKEIAFAISCTPPALTRIPFFMHKKSQSKD